jgi:hypothetical protein
MIPEIERQSFPLAVNGPDYFWPLRTTVVVCFDGCDPAYLHAARAVNAIPVIDRMVRDGFAAVALAAMPTFTNPNNVSIVCGVALALARDQACQRFELPEDREGDLVVIAEEGIAIGARVEDHDLSQLAGERLRADGGLAEQEVPFLISHPITAQHQAELGMAPLRNFDIFSVALNCGRA